MKLREVGIAYDGRSVFAGLNATIEGAGLTALVGPSGSGKSSLLAVVAGVSRSTHGQVLLENADGSPVPGGRASIWIPQSLNALGSRSALDNVMIAPLADGLHILEAREHARQCLADVGLGGKEQQVVRSLSGGELQRVIVARALASNRELVLADEPTANLDAENTAQIVRLLREVATRKTVIVATHDRFVAESADSVISLR